MQPLRTIRKSCLTTLMSEMATSRGNRSQKLILNKANVPSSLKLFKNNPRPYRISVEGNIGAGKSTIISYLGNNPGVEIYAEPIDWWRNVNGHNLLELLYKDIHKWYNVFQKYVQLTRVKIQTSPPKHDSTKVQIFERSIQNNRFCFLEQAYKAGIIEEPSYDVLDAWYDWIEENIDIEIDFVIYLRTSPSIVYERMKSRGRKEEELVSLDYLKQLHEAHENWIFGGRIKKESLLVINADEGLAEVLKQCDMNTNDILHKSTVDNV